MYDQHVNIIELVLVVSYLVTKNFQDCFLKLLAYLSQECHNQPWSHNHTYKIWMCVSVYVNMISTFSMLLKLSVPSFLHRPFWSKVKWNPKNIHQNNIYSCILLKVSVPSFLCFFMDHFCQMEDKFQKKYSSK